MQNTPTFPIQLPEGAEPDRLRDALQHLLTRVMGMTPCSSGPNPRSPP